MRVLRSTNAFFGKWIIYCLHLIPGQAVRPDKGPRDLYRFSPHGFDYASAADRPACFIGPSQIPEPRYRVVPMLRVTSRIRIPAQELKETFVHAPGPGGQNVNKVATAVQLRFNIVHSPSLPDAVRARLMRLAGKRVNSSGEIVIEAHRHRTRERNRRDAVARLSALIRQAALKPKTRVATRPSAAAKRRRLQEKKRRAGLKRLRGPVAGGEDD